MIKIGNNKIGDGKPVFIVAEAGINHNGDVETAKKMIKEASKCGVDAIKFQTFTPDELFSKRLDPELFEMSKNWLLDAKEHMELKKYSDKIGILFFSTPCGNKSVHLLRKLKIKAVKIASGDLNNFKLISEVQKTNVPIILSTGMSTITEITSSVNFIKKNHSDLILLHCNSSYPTPPNDANLSTIPFLKQTFDIPVGYSDHTIRNEACLAAVSLGANILEKHFTLDKKMEGPDQKLSSNPTEFSKLVNQVRFIEKCLGSPRTEITKSETKFRKLMRKSIGAAKDIKKNSILRNEDLTFFRPGTGISPNLITQLVGKRILRKVKKGELVHWDMF